MRSDGGTITSRPVPVSAEAKKRAKKLEAEAKKRARKEKQAIEKIKRKSAKAILKDALEPVALNPADEDEPADPVELASTAVIDESTDDAVAIGCSCRDGCPTCLFIHAVETDSLVLEEP